MDTKSRVGDDLAEAKAISFMQLKITKLFEFGFSYARHIS